MPFISNPDKVEGACIAISEKNIILKRGGAPLNFADLQAFHAQFPEADFFSEPLFHLAAITVPAAVTELNPAYEAIPLRQYFAQNGEEKSFIPFRAKALLTWRATHKFCAACGAKLEDSKTLSARECPSCRKIYFPRIEPCIIVVVHKDGKILLANHVSRNQDIYACIAGFMESGESAEAAVAREVFEETGLKIKNITYRGSQSWPFPDQLMLGFTADYASGEISVQKEEIADARWFDPNNLPASPKPGSIAYRLIHNEF